MPNGSGRAFCIATSGSLVLCTIVPYTSFRIERAFVVSYVTTQKLASSDMAELSLLVQGIQIDATSHADNIQIYLFNSFACLNQADLNKSFLQITKLVYICKILHKKQHTRILRIKSIHAQSAHVYKITI